MENDIEILPGGSIKGELLPPGDKSISHRSVIFGSLAKGESVFTHFLNSEDCHRTLTVFQEMGVKTRMEDDKLMIHGVGLKGLKSPGSSLDMGNSGTSARLLLGILAAQSFSSKVVGDDSLSKRPMDRVVEPLRLMGANIQGRDKGKYLPLEIHEAKLKGIHYKLPVPSAQVKSCLLLAGLYAEGKTEIEEPIISRDHTERALHAFGADYTKEGNVHRVHPFRHLEATSYEIPADISSAAFFIVGALISKNSQIRLKNIGLNMSRIGLLSVLKRMNADIRIENINKGPEPMGDLIVSSSQLKGVRVEKEEIPLLVDEIPILTLAASLAEGETVITGAGELRVKESDRIATMVQNLKAVGARAEELKDGFRIKGVEKLKGGEIQSFGDHRVAMAFAIAGLAGTEPITIDDCRCISTSYPNFFEDLKKLKQ